MGVKGLAIFSLLLMTGAQALNLAYVAVLTIPAKEITANAQEMFSAWYDLQGSIKNVPWDGFMETINYLAGAAKYTANNTKNFLATTKFVDAVGRLDPDDMPYYDRVQQQEVWRPKIKKPDEEFVINATNMGSGHPTLIGTMLEPNMTVLVYSLTPELVQSQNQVLMDQWILRDHNEHAIPETGSLPEPESKVFGDAMRF